MATMMTTTDRYLRVSGAATDLDAAAFDAVCELAETLNDRPTTDEHDIIAAARMPASAAAVLSDLYRMLELTPPAWVVAALGSSD
jgi:hypothetical protein